MAAVVVVVVRHTNSFFQVILAVDEGKEENGEDKEHEL